MRIQWLAAIAVLVAGAAQGELWMPSVFGDHMVLQQEARIPVWGTAEPGADVTVTIGDESARTKVGADRKWMVRLDDVDVGGPYTMTVKAGADSKTFSDVLVGEVWVASGQSNMQWPVTAAKNPDKEIAASSNPKLRLFYVERKTATSPKPDCNAQWTLATPETVKDFSAVAYFFGRELQQRQGVPVGMIHTSWGGTSCEAWTSRAALEANPKAAPILKNWDGMMANYQAKRAEWEKAHAAWEKERDAAKAAGKEVPAEPRAPVSPDDPNRPANLYNGMIAPLLPYAIKGAIWYQGESNAGRAYQYRSIFPAMIQNWRNDWGQGDFPFIFVQLANFMERKPEPGESAWAELREAQSMTLSLPKTGMALAIDIGEEKDIHPKNKQDVGQRLWYAAERVAYNNRATDRTGPLYKSMTVSGNKATIHLENVRRGLKTLDGGPVKGFAVAGADHKFVWADAQISGDTLIVSSPQVAKPVAVRYGWADNPAVNVYSGVGLPLSPFRTDDFPGLTISAE